MLLHRIADPGRALTEQPHKGFLEKALRYAPSDQTYPKMASRCLHGDLISYHVSQPGLGYYSPHPGWFWPPYQGLLLLEFDPEGQAVNIAALTLLPGSKLFEAVIAEVWEMAVGLGFFYLTCASKRRGMGRLLIPKGWLLMSGPDSGEFGTFHYYGPNGGYRTCRECGCTDSDCSACIERTGERCFWVAADLCSACAAVPREMERLDLSGSARGYQANVSAAAVLLFHQASVMSAATMERWPGAAFVALPWTGADELFDPPPTLADLPDGFPWGGE